MAVVNRVVVLASDLSGEVGAESVEFDIASQVRDAVKEFGKIKLDLLPAEAEEIDSALIDALDTYTDAVRAITGDLYETVAAMRAAGANTAGGAATKSSGGEGEAVRAWARENGFTVGDRGRIGGTILEAYAAHKRGEYVPTGEGTGKITAEQDEPTDADLNALEAETV